MNRHSRIPAAARDRGGVQQLAALLCLECVGDSVVVAVVDDVDDVDDVVA